MEEVKEVILEEGQLPDINSIVTQMFGDETDPRSNAYVRKLYRPKIHWWRMILYLLALSGMVAGTVLVMGGIHCPVWQCVVGALLVCLICLMLTAKYVALFAVRVYQRYAPDAVRNKCRFEPSCSEYMILAITKYGVLKGVRMGLGRIKRCNVNGGGIDYP